MADKELRSVRFPGLDDRYVVPEGGTGGSGQDGYSPAAKVEATADGAKITITDKTGTTEAEVKNGKDGAKGAKGDTGATGPQGPAGDDYVLTDADKTEIAAEVIAGGVEAELGDEPFPAPASAAVGQIVKITAVDENGKITETEAVDMPSGSDASLSMTGAAVGQIAKIAAVDADGKPTAWSPVDMPSGDEAWELLADQAALEEDAVSVGFDVPDCKKYMVMISLVNTSGSAGTRTGAVSMNGDNNKKAVTGFNSFIAQSGTRSAVFIFEKCDGRMNWVSYCSANGDGLIDGISENMSFFNSGAFPAPDTVIRLNVSSLNQAVGYFIGAGSRIKIYGVRA